MVSDEKCSVLCTAQSWLKNVTLLPLIPPSYTPPPLKYPSVSHLYFLLYPQLICSSQFSSLDLRAVINCLVNIHSSRLGYAITYVLVVSSWGQELCQPATGMVVLLSVARPIL